MKRLNHTIMPCRGSGSDRIGYTSHCSAVISTVTDTGTDCHNLPVFSFFFFWQTSNPGHNTSCLVSTGMECNFLMCGSHDAKSTPSLAVTPCSCITLIMSVLFVLHCHVMILLKKVQDECLPRRSTRQLFAFFVRNPGHVMITTRSLSECTLPSDQMQSRDRT